MKIDWKYPIYFGLDTKSFYKSLWLGWILITWAENLDSFGWEVDISFQPGL